MDMLLHFLPYVLVFFAAGFAKGIIGLGLPTVAMGMLGLAMLPAQAAALLIIPSTVTTQCPPSMPSHTEPSPVPRKISRSIGHRRLINALR